MDVIDLLSFLLVLLFSASQLYEAHQFLVTAVGATPKCVHPIIEQKWLWSGSSCDCRNNTFCICSGNEIPFLSLRSLNTKVQSLPLKYAGGAGAFFVLEGL